MKTANLRGVWVSQRRLTNRRGERSGSKEKGRGEIKGDGRGGFLVWHLLRGKGWRLVGWVIVGIVLSMVGIGLAETPSIPQNPDESVRESQNLDELYRLYSERFFFHRYLNLTQDYLARERFLAWLYKGVREEVSKRAEEDPASTLRLLDLPQVGLGREIEVPPIPEDAPLRVQYQEYEKSVREEFNRKYLQARTLKDQLIITASPAALHRMFRNDLGAALLSYRDGDYPTALLQFDECINAYGFKNIADVLFYRGETLWALGLYYPASEDYRKVVEETDNRDIRKWALEKLLSYYGSNGNAEGVLDYWEVYQRDFGDSSSGEFLGLSERVASYLMAMERWGEARSILERLPRNRSGSDGVNIKLVDCSLAQLNLEDAEVLLNQRRDNSPEALLRLGVLHYLKGDFDQAFIVLSQIKGDKGVKERSELLSIWSLYHLGLIPQALELSMRFLQEFPSSQYQYEVKVIVGYCNELLGKGTEADKEYYEVIRSIDDRQEYRDYNYEIKSLTETIAELDRLEELVFMGGYQELFPSYLELRKKLVALLSQVRLKRAIKTAPILKEIISERELIVNLLKEQGGLEEVLYQVQDPKLYDQYDRVVSRLLELQNDLERGIAYYQRQKSLLQREEDARFELLMKDSLNVWLEEEFQLTNAALELIQRLRREGAEDLEVVAALGGQEVGIKGTQERIMALRRELERFGKERVESRLDEWAEIALRRHSFGNLPFDTYTQMEERDRALDGYIQTVSQILELRERGSQPEEVLPAELKPQWQEGKPMAYYAPMIPLWGGVEVKEAKPSPEKPSSEQTGSPQGEMTPPPEKGEEAPSQSGAPPPSEQENPSGEEVKGDSEEGKPIAPENGESPSSPDETDPKPESGDSQSPTGGGL